MKLTNCNLTLHVPITKSKLVVETFLLAGAITMGKIELPFLKILLGFCLVVLLACGASDSLPTRIPTVSVPTMTPLPTATFSVHQNVTSLVRTVLGNKLATFDSEQYTEYRGQSYPDGRVGYALDLSVTSPEERNREEMLQTAYTLLSEIHYNFNEDLMFAMVVLRSHENDVACAFNVGIGYQAVEQFLPRNQPADMDAWYSALDRSDYYGDLPDQTEALLAYANDPRSVLSCELDHWK